MSQIRLGEAVRGLKDITSMTKEYITSDDPERKAEIGKHFEEMAAAQAQAKSECAALGVDENGRIRIKNFENAAKNYERLKDSDDVEARADAAAEYEIRKALVYRYFMYQAVERLKSK